VTMPTRFELGDIDPSPEIASANVSPPVVQTKGLTKRYGSRTVVDALDMHIPPGVVAGFIGPNGAGKTTTLRMLLGLVRPTAGGGQVFGMPLDSPASYLPSVGALIESPAFYPGLRAGCATWLSRPRLADTSCRGFPWCSNESGWPIAVAIATAPTPWA